MGQIIVLVVEIGVEADNEALRAAFERLTEVGSEVIATFYFRMRKTSTRPSTGDCRSME